MKAVRSHDYRIDGYGNVKFIKVDIDSGHFFGGKLEKKTQPALRGWKKGTNRPQNWAVFYCKMACAKEDGLDQYRYHDKGLKPPKRMLRERNAA